MKREKDVMMRRGKDVSGGRGLLRAMVSLAVSLLVLAGLTGCDDPEDSEPEEVGRTVLVYIVANNNLGSSSFGDVRGFDGLDIEEMRAAARNGALGGNRLILFHAPFMGIPAIKEVHADGSVETLEELSAELPATSALRMAEVIDEVKRLSPARSYGLVLWSHASGWIEDGMEEEPPYGENTGAELKSFGQDGNNKMNVTTLARVLEGRGFDFVWFDCCHMATVEVAYELRQVTRRIIGSASELPSAGMPYDLTLPYLMKDEADVAGAAAQVFGYYDNKTGWERTCTMSVIDTDGLDALASASRIFFSLASGGVDGSGVQKFRVTGSYYDFVHYLEQLSGAGGETGAESALTDAYRNVSRALEETVVYSVATPWLWQGWPGEEVRIDRHCGLSTYIVSYKGGEYVSGYNRLQWWRDAASALAF